MAEVRETQEQFSRKRRSDFPASARSGIRGMLAALILTLSAPRMRRFPVSILILLLLMLSGCASLDEDPTKGWSAQRLYTEGKTALKVRLSTRW